MSMLLGSPSGLLRVLVVGPLAYLALLAMLRLSGKRTLGKMNMFDFVGTVAIGSTLANTLLGGTVSLAEGVLALFVLVAMQVAISWAAVRFGVFERAINAEPTLLAHRGRVLEDALRRERMTVDELLAAVRSKGFPRVEDVEAVVLEADGTFSVLPRPEREKPSALGDVVGVPE